MNDTNCHSYREALEGLIDGDIEESSLAALRTHVNSCASCRNEYEWILAISADLEFMAEELVSDAPEIDIIASVMSALPDATRGADPVASFVKPQARLRAFRWRWASMAAAATAAMVAGWIAFGPGLSSNGDLPGDRIAKPPVPQSADEEPGEVFERVEVAEDNGGAPGEIPLLQTEPIRISIFEERGRDDSPDSNGDTLTRDDITQTYLASLAPDNLDGMERLLKLAEISREQAAEILADADASPEARVAAAQIVGGPEAAQALFEIVGHDSDSPYVQAQLAQLYAGSPEMEAQALEHTMALRDKDPDNAYWAYLDAERLFGMGEIEAGLESLRVASEMDSLSAYSLEGARYREQYMIEGGVDPDLAHLLSSLTAGVLEMNDISRLASDLLQYGNEARESGDETTAELIYQSVANLGMQVDNGAVLVQERNTAAAVTDAAAASLETLSAFLEDSAAVDQLLVVTSTIVSDVSTYFGSLTETLLTDAVAEAVSGIQESLWLHIADSILASGDLGLVDAIGNFILP